MIGKTFWPEKLKYIVLFEPALNEHEAVMNKGYAAFFIVGLVKL